MFGGSEGIPAGFRSFAFPDAFRYGRDMPTHERTGGRRVVPADRFDDFSLRFHRGLGDTGQRHRCFTALRAGQAATRKGSFPVRHCGRLSDEFMDVLLALDSSRPVRPDGKELRISGPQRVDFLGRRPSPRPRRRIPVSMRRRASNNSFNLSLLMRRAKAKCLVTESDTFVASITIPLPCSTRMTPEHVQDADGFPKRIPGNSEHFRELTLRRKAIVFFQVTGNDEIVYLADRLFDDGDLLYRLYVHGPFSLKQDGIRTKGSRHRNAQSAFCL